MLTDKAIQAIKPQEKRTKVSDGGGLVLWVEPNGSKLWRFRYYFAGREKMISLGTYPATSLAKARKKRDDARTQLEDGIDPSAKRQAERAANADSFAAVAEEWLRQNGHLEEGTRDQYRARLTKYVNPYVGRWSISKITAPELLKVLKRIESKGTIETAHRVRSLLSRVFRYAVATGRAERDPAADLRGAIASVRTRNFAAVIDPKSVGALLRAIENYQGQPSVIYALKLAPLVFVRPGELRGAEWSEIDLAAAEWRIPASRMKMDERHIVPLPRQAVALLRELKTHTGNGRLLFPGLRSREREISENTLNAALRRMGYGKDDMTGHGFRTVASTLLNELGWHPDLIELQLAHKPRDRVRAAYNRAERLEERRQMMQTWADYLDRLKTGGDIVPVFSEVVR
ncbi:MAG: integrase arm-type DNA-binding domain-containing protein [Pseudomonadales bacterium]|jgi:integrase